VKPWTLLLPLLLAAACSGFDEGEGGVVAIEVETPEFQELEVGEQVQVVARALDVNGAVLDVPLEWQSSGTAVTVDGSGLVTAVQPGEANVQAISGTLPSAPVPFDVVARADTIIIAGDSVVTIPIEADPPPTARLTVRLETITTPGPVSGSPVIFQITSPVAGATPVVQLAGGIQSDTITTASDGTAFVDIGAVPAQVPPDTAIVQVRAEHLRGSAVPGSGQRFIVLFQ
jgi:hypothetical protein